MLKILVSYALGPWGLKVLFFYLENSAIINSIIFVYGVFLVMAHYNFSKIVSNLEDQFKSQSEKKGNIKVIQIDVGKGINEGKNFPFVSGQISLIARKVNKDNIVRYLKRETKWVKLTEGTEVIYI